MDPKLQVFLMLKLAKSSLQWLATIWNRVWPRLCGLTSSDVAEMQVASVTLE